jgi:cation diffusion facilitator CzcD-associated flavoprotein CzcO
LAAAKTFLDVNPEASLIILDSAASVGGVWAQERLFPGLKSNNMLGTYEYSDFPMDEATYGVGKGEHIPGQVVHKYLRDYAEKFGIYQRIKLNSKVESIERRENAWLVTRAGGGNSAGTILAEKLIVATGLTSDPFIPEMKGQDSFDAPFFHYKDLAQYSETFETAKLPVVYGGTKSGWDACYAYTSRGIAVKWIIRSSGHGPAWMAPPYVTPLKKWLEKLVHTRLLTFFSPCIWGAADGHSWIRGFLHSTRIGRWIVDKFWAVLENDVVQVNQYESHPETKKLRPWNNPFFVATGLSILNYEKDFFGLVKSGLIQIHVENISHLSPRTVHLESGRWIKTDVFISCTGWKHQPPFKFLPERLEVQLGIPGITSDKEGVVAANEANLALFPRLRSQPLPHSTLRKGDSNPYRLYRFIVPPTRSLSNIAFAGCLMTISTALIAQTQALWIAAYLAGNLSLPTGDQMSKEAILWSEFCKLRYPEGFGARFPDFAFDAVPYLDVLLRDLGLSSRRKSAWCDLFSPYGVEDYRGLVDEWRSQKAKLA